MQRSRKEEVGSLFWPTLYNVTACEKHNTMCKNNNRSNQ